MNSRVSKHRTPVARQGGSTAKPKPDKGREPQRSVSVTKHGQPTAKAAHCMTKLLSDGVSDEGPISVDEENVLLIPQKEGSRLQSTKGPKHMLQFLSDGAIDDGCIVLDGGSGEGASRVDDEDVPLTSQTEGSRLKSTKGRKHMLQFLSDGAIDDGDIVLDGGSGEGARRVDDEDVPLTPQTEGSRLKSTKGPTHMLQFLSDEAIDDGDIVLDGNLGKGTILVDDENVPLTPKMEGSRLKSTKGPTHMLQFLSDEAIDDGDIVLDGGSGEGARRVDDEDVPLTPQTEGSRLKSTKGPKHMLQFLSDEAIDDGDIVLDRGEGAASPLPEKAPRLNVTNGAASPSPDRAPRLKAIDEAAMMGPMDTMDEDAIENLHFELEDQHGGLGVVDRIGSIISTDSSELDDDDTTCLAAFVSSSVFETGSVIMIVVSSVEMAWELDQRVGNTSVVQFFENWFTLFFLIEWILRVRVFGLVWFKNGFNIADSIVVWVPGVLSVWMFPFAGLDSEFGIVRIVRLTRILRIVRGLRRLPFYTDLKLLVEGLLGSVTTVLFTLMILTIAILTSSLCFVQLVGRKDLYGSSEQVLAAWAKFRGFFQTARTLTRFMHNDSAQDIMHILMGPLPLIWIPLLIFSAVSSLVLMNLVTGVIVNNALKRAECIQEELLAEARQKKMADSLELAEAFRSVATRDGEIALSDIKELMESAEMEKALAGQDLSPSDVENIFGLLEHNGEAMNLENFLAALRGWTGPAKVKDARRLQRRLRGLTRATLEFDQTFESGAELVQMPHDRKEVMYNRMGAISKEVRKRSAAMSEEIYAVTRTFNKLTAELEHIDFDQIDVLNLDLAAFWKGESVTVSTKSAEPPPPLPPKTSSGGFGV
eukprot:TRINITY_DN10533_c0_g1_i3.p1 TRINITY_DN10533_c0_g1~~TRINITY_DN10533_c0_g1_i3.p1  ORF type:complete len:873 (-),score=174.01 TRINITY_DN10533_c0_g1_i3:77-2695(-)